MHAEQEQRGPQEHLAPSPGRGARQLRPMVAVIALAAAFGGTAAWIKGNGGGVRDAIGNVSAVWLLLPFLAGAASRARRPVSAALAGLAASLAALAGFYFADSFVLDLGQHPWLTDLALTMRAAPYYAVPALITGPAFGALGYWWRRRRSLAAAATIAAFFVLEPLAWWLENARLGGGAAYPVPGYPAVWLSEITIGIAAFAVLATIARRADDRDQASLTVGSR